MSKVPKITIRNLVPLLIRSLKEENAELYESCVQELQRLFDRKPPAAWDFLTSGGLDPEDADNIVEQHIGN